MPEPGHEKRKMGSKTCLDHVKGGKSYLYRDWNSEPSAVQPVPTLYTDCAVPAPYRYQRFEGKYLSVHNRTESE
jgi:hypothetical protein